MSIWHIAKNAFIQSKTRNAFTCRRWVEIAVIIATDPLSRRPNCEPVASLVETRHKWRLQGQLRVGAAILRPVDHHREPLAEPRTSSSLKTLKAPNTER
jgi:hypothetical protein